MKKTKPIPPRDFPSYSARATFTQDYFSSKLAFREGDDVVLEFTPKSVVVHHFTEERNCSWSSLGTILYTYLLEPSNNKPSAKKRALDRLRPDEELAASGKIFLIRRIVDGKGFSVCLFCGKKFLPKATESTSKKHLELHHEK